MNNLLYFSDTADGYANLGLDEWFLDHVGPDEVILYFYVNGNAVIIGKNQNPWKECDLAAMERDGVQLVRRVSGGGAVYHDEGNLNFSFIAGENRYDLDRQMNVILKTVRRFGIPCEFSGRNDLLAGGKKFSGNAFCVRHGRRQHHGTLLVSADLGRIARYLTVDPRKIRSKGIDSVRSRVCNLTEFCPELTVPALKEAIPAVFREVYGAYDVFSPTAEEEAEIARYRAKHASREWRLGATPKFDYELDERFLWGGIQILFSLEKNVVREVHAFSDANDPAVCPEAESRLSGAFFDASSIADRLAASPLPELRELAQSVRTKGL